jgi:mannosyl-3-phosphoglycerate phosphatase family protein
MTAAGDALRLVFTDLDGSLLDHHDYSFRAALPTLEALESAAIPVMAATSKTRLEVQQLREQLGNRHPFIVENGAAIVIPAGYFPTRPADTLERDGYWVCELGAPRQRWLQLLASLEDTFGGDFEYFSRAGVEGIAAMTGLSQQQAALANQREYSEPVQWLGSDARRREFIEALRVAGATVLQGGRFLTVAGDSDKGRALAWLRAASLQARGAAACHDLAIGDSGNDCAMLEAAETALLVRSPVHDFPVLKRRAGIIRSGEYGPAGWAEGVAQWLRQLQADK